MTEEERRALEDAEARQRRAALQVAVGMDERAGMGAPVRRTFIRPPEGGGPSPLVQLLSSREGSGGGRGGRTRLALLLSLLWINAKAPFDTHRPATFLADLTGFTYGGKVPDRRARQATSAMLNAEAELAARGFVTLRKGTPVGATPRTITLLHEGGSRQPYSIPTGSDGDSYIRVPEELWTRGALTHLTGPGIATLLALLELAGREPHPFTLGSGIAMARFGISDTTRKKGLKNLYDIDIVDKRLEEVPGDDQRTRKRNVYTLSPAYYPKHWKAGTP